ncbi:MAG: hypothetical protein GEU88_16850 [Solirubrobacterales bacterium]|nr:hypothetical protein [Solirubrobacterales bacterium]
MSLLPALPSVKPRLFLCATAGLAVLAIGSIAADDARAVPTGGIGSAAGGAASSPEDGGDARSTGRDFDQSSRNRTGVKYERLWDRTSRTDRRWARTTSECESGGNPDAIGGGGLYRGAFQFMKSTWKHSPKSPGGDPIKYSYRTQAVVAVALKHHDGAGHWPVCG